VFFSTTRPCPLSLRRPLYPLITPSSPFASTFLSPAPEGFQVVKSPQSRAAPRDDVRPVSHGSPTRCRAPRYRVWIETRDSGPPPGAPSLLQASLRVRLHFPGLHPPRLRPPTRPAAAPPPSRRAARSASSFPLHLRSDAMTWRRSDRPGCVCRCRRSACGTVRCAECSPATKLTTPFTVRPNRSSFQITSTSAAAYLGDRIRQSGMSAFVVRSCRTEDPPCTPVRRQGASSWRSEATVVGEPPLA